MQCTMSRLPTPTNQTVFASPSKNWRRSHDDKMLRLVAKELGVQDEEKPKHAGLHHSKHWCGFVEFRKDG